MARTDLTPTELARAALRRIAEARLPPTPEQFARLYHEAAGTPQPADAEAAPREGAADPLMVERLDALVGEILSTGDDLATGIDHYSAQMAASLDSLVAETPPPDTVQLLQVIVATAKDMHVTLKASHAELVETRKSLAELRDELSESRTLLGQDALTGTENRRAMETILVREVSRARREREPLSVVMVDLDHFKSVNDTYGHAAGDAALIHLTRLAKSMLRGHDAFIRYGGEEFVLVLPETALEGAVYVAERLQALLRRSPLLYAGKTIPMAFSAGVTTLKDDDTEAILVRRADEALYSAKRSGRDRVVAAA